MSSYNKPAPAVVFCCFFCVYQADNDYYDNGYKLEEI